MTPLCKIELYGSVRQRKRLRKKREKQKAGRAKKKTLKIISQFRNKLKRKATPAEKRFERILQEGGFKYEFQKVFKTGSGYKIVDFHLSDYDIVIEIDGGYHNDPKQKEHDQERTRAILKVGKIKKVLRLTNQNVLDSIPAEILKNLIKFICPEVNILLILEQGNINGKAHQSNPPI